MKVKITLGLLVAFAFVLIAGCTGSSKEILAEDFKKMNNDQLLEYFYRINDEIDKQEKQISPSFGVGVGGFGRHTGGGVGIGTGGTAYTAEDLRQRRVEVRMELKRRNITP